MKAAQDALALRAVAAKQALQVAKPKPLVPPVIIAAVTQKVTPHIQVIEKAVPRVSTSIFQDDTKVVFAGAPASPLSPTTRAESLMDESASEYDDLGAELEAFIEEEIAPVVAKSKRERVVVEPAAPPKTVEVKTLLRAIEKPAGGEKSAPAIVSEPGSVVTLTHMRMRATGEPRPLAALFNRLSGGAPTSSGGTEGKKSLLFERMKRT
jgi:hypothetical protein